MPITSSTLDFLFENKINDSTTWFNEHKPEYKKLVMEPIVELVEAMTPAMLAIDKELEVAPKVHKTISRVRRDTRYSKDKTLYRDVMWVFFTKRGRKYQFPPGYVFEFSPDGFRYGCGYYDAPTKTMAVMRELVLAGDKDFKKAQRAFEKQDIFKMVGTKFKRPRYANEPVKLQQWLERRSLSFMATSQDFELLFSASLADVISQHFTTLAPIYHFICKCNEIAQQRTYHSENNH